MIAGKNVAKIHKVFIIDVQTLRPSYAIAESFVLFKLRNLKFGKRHKDRSPASVTGVSLRFKLCSVFTCSVSNCNPRSSN